MRRNEMLNKKVMKALAVGASAVMLLQPVGSVADDINTESTNNVEDVKTEEKAEEEKTEEEKTEEAKINVDEVELDEVISVLDSVSANDPVEDTTDTLTEKEVEKYVGEFNKAQEVALEGVKTISGYVTTLGQTVADRDNYENNEINNIIDEANAKLDKLAEDIKAEGADTNAILAEAAAIKSEAETAIKEKVAEYNAKVDATEEAIDNYNGCANGEEIVIDEEEGTILIDENGDPVLTEGVKDKLEDAISVADETIKNLDAKIDEEGAFADNLADALTKADELVENGIAIGKIESDADDKISLNENNGGFYQPQTVSVITQLAHNSFVDYYIPALLNGADSANVTKEERETLAANINAEGGSVAAIATFDKNNLEQLYEDEYKYLAKEATETYVVLSKIGTPDNTMFFYVLVEDDDISFYRMETMAMATHYTKEELKEAGRQGFSVSNYLSNRTSALTELKNQVIAAQTDLNKVNAAIKTASTNKSTVTAESFDKKFTNVTKPESGNTGDNGGSGNTGDNGGNGNTGDNGGNGNTGDNGGNGNTGDNGGNVTPTNPVNPSPTNPTPNPGTDNDDDNQNPQGGNTGDSGNNGQGGNTGDSGNNGQGGNTGNAGNNGQGGNAGDSGNNSQGGNTGNAGNNGQGGNAGNAGNNAQGGNAGAAVNQQANANTGNAVNQQANANTGNAANQQANATVNNANAANANAGAAETEVAETQEEETVETVETQEEKTTEVETLDIDENATPLANGEGSEEIDITDGATPLATLEEQQKMSWWWLLIVLVLGTTGAELYRRHQLKKKEEAVKADEK